MNDDLSIIIIIISMVIYSNLLLTRKCEEMIHCIRVNYKYFFNIEPTMWHFPINFLFCAFPLFHKHLKRIIQVAKVFPMEESSIIFIKTCQLLFCTPSQFPIAIGAPLDSHFVSRFEIFYVRKTTIIIIFCVESFFVF